jgi:hypothetical protein
MSEFDRAPDSVLEQMEEVRTLGPCNMLSLECVSRVADDLGMDELFDFCRELQTTYRRERSKRWMQALNEMVEHAQTTTTS